MADFANVDQYIAALANRSHEYTFDRVLGTALGNVQRGSHWLTTGFPGPGVAPTTAAIPTKATPGALANFANPTSGDVLRLQSIDGVVQNQPSSLVLFDRLAHMGGLSGTNVASQAVNTPALTRGDTDGVGVIAFLETYTGVVASSQQTWTVTYTNSFGVGSRTGTVVMPANMVTGRLLQIALQTGDLGVRSVQSIILGVTSGQVGNYGVTLARRITPIHTAAVASHTARTGLPAGPPIVEPDACLWLVATTFVTSGSGRISGGFTLTASG